jgi:hypothetical protein
VQYHYKTGEKLAEGDYWNGYRTGFWIEYDKDGGYSKMYYPTDYTILMNRCGHSMPGLTEWYDQDRNLLNSWEFPE